MTLSILRVNGSMRLKERSRSRQLTDALIEQIGKHYGSVNVHTRDLMQGPPLVHDAWIDANFTDPGARNLKQRSVLAQSDALMSELVDADVLVMGVPIYNFGVPAAVKAWIDMIVRAKETFRYTSEGPEGLLKGKRAYCIVVSGGTQIDGEVDFATPYLRHILGFIGITDLTIIGSSLANTDAASANRDALDAIRNLFN